MREIHKNSIRNLYSLFEAQDLDATAVAVCRLIRSNIDVFSEIRAHPLGDEWSDHVVLAMQNYFKHSAGFVYLAATVDHGGLIKLGKTAMPPLERMRTLSGEGTLNPFKLLHAVPVHDRHWVELACHTRLASYRVDMLKEFFCLPFPLLQACISEVVDADRLLFKAQGVYTLGAHASC